MFSKELAECIREVEIENPTSLYRYCFLCSKKSPLDVKCHQLATLYRYVPPANRVYTLFIHIMFMVLVTYNYFPLSAAAAFRQYFPITFSVCWLCRITFY